jgi:NAD(P)-dependent dehydrogenase (short-subunit alcohol dehydrogenase family)
MNVDSNKHALVIGGTSGIGRALVRLWVGQGMAVSVIGKEMPPDGDLHQPAANYYVTDLTDQAAVERILSKIIASDGKISSLAFFQRYRGDAPWQGDIQIILTATKNIIEFLADDFSEQGERAIVMIASVANHFVAEEQPVSYHVAKAGLTQMARYFAVTLGGRGIRVNCISPGVVIKDEAKGFYAQNQSILDLYREIIPLGRMASSEEIAQVAAFLCSEGASYITGQDIVVDGGLTLTMQASIARRVTSLNTIQITQSNQSEKKNE